MSEEEEVRSLRERLAKVEKDLRVRILHLDLGTDGWFEWDLEDPDQQHVSPKFWKFLGYEKEADRPAEWVDLIHEEDLPTFAKALDEHLNKGKEYRVTVRCRHAENHWEWLVCRGQILRKKNGAPARFVGTFQSITDLKRAERDLEQFAFHAAHDMKEPLRKISAFGERLNKHSGELPKKGQVYLDKMLDATRRMGNLIDDLLQLARVSRREKEFEAVDLNDLINEVFEDHGEGLRRCCARVTVESLETIEADWTQMRQLFHNLVSNSIKFRRQDTPLKISVKGRRVTVNTYEVSFSDNGIGFEDKYKHRILEVFQRLHGRSKYEGTGIGLAVCARIVQSHGGTLIANGFPGYGATFVMRFPMEGNFAVTGSRSS